MVSGAGGEIAGGGDSGVPVSYCWWLGGITVSLLGSQIQGFGLGWAATAHGASVAAPVLTAGLVPGLVLMLVGGAVADSRGPWLLMVRAPAKVAGPVGVLVQHRITARYLQVLGKIVVQLAGN